MGSQLQSRPSRKALSSVEICAGGGGQAIGLEQAGFEHVALVENDPAACRTLQHNRPEWSVFQIDVREFDARQFHGVDLLAGGVPCPPFSVAGKQLGERDERDLFPELIRLTGECRPRAVLIENVRGLLSPKFDGYRSRIITEFEQLGYRGSWKLLNASDFGVPQSRPRAIFVALRGEAGWWFQWPTPSAFRAPSVGESLGDLMASGGWNGAKTWKAKADGIAPALVGGSKKHGGADLGPTRARKTWESLGINGRSLAEHPPAPDFKGLPRLTLEMAARIQGFPADWKFIGKKTAAYRQIGNAFPPPVARAVGLAIHQALTHQPDHVQAIKDRLQGQVANLSA